MNSKGTIAGMLFVVGFIPMKTTDPYRLAFIQKLLVKEARAFIKALEAGASSAELAFIRNKMQKVSKMLDAKLNEEFQRIHRFSSGHKEEVKIKKGFTF